MTKADDTHRIYSELTSIFQDVLGDETIVLTPELKAGDVEGWDSLKHVDILILVQDRFGLKLSSREIDSLNTVGDLVDLIRRR